MKLLSIHTYLKIFILVSIFFSFNAQQIFAQFSADPYEVIYDDIHVWMGQGYIAYLPDFRPLPEVILASAMMEVIEKGNTDAAAKAKRYLKKINDTGYRITTSLFGRYNRSTITTESGDSETRTQAYGNAPLSINGSARLNPWTSISASMGGHIIGDLDNEEYKEMRETYYLNTSYNRLEELEKVRAGAIGEITAYGTFSSRSSFSIGKKNLFLHTGFMRRSVGPFHEDGIFVSPQAPQSPNIIVYWGNDKIAATWGLFSLSSSQEYITFKYDEDNNREIETEFSTRNKLNKFFTYNTLTLRPNEKFEFILFEGVMFGTFNLGYILPIKLIYSTDSLSDFAAGNLISGMAFKYKPLPTLTIPFNFLIDDISVSQYVRLNFYSKLKAAAEIATQWTPKINAIKEITLGYQIVTPYTYTHAPSESNELYSTAYNTENFTHFDQHFATSLDPSSHRAYLKSNFNINKYSTIGSILRLEQHNNASEGILSGPLNDGSIIDDGYRSVYDDDNGSESATFQNRIDFLVGTVETIWEAGINYGFYIPLARRINFFGDFNYTYRYIDNYQLVYKQTKTEGIYQMEIGLEFTLKFNKRKKENK